MIVSLPDELIMAFADGELDGRAALRVREAIRNDDAIANKHQVYVTTRAILSRAFAPVLSEPVPERLRQAIRNS